MIPSTLTGVAVLAAVLIPGYCWTVVADRRRVRSARSGVLDAVDVLVVGTVSVFLSAGTVFGLGEVIDVVPGLREFVNDPVGDIRVNPWRTGLAAVLVVALASIGSSIAVRLRHKDSPDSLHPESVWRRVFSHGNAEALSVAVQLTTGDTIEGYLWEYSLGIEGDRDLALQKPISVRYAGTDENVPQDIDAVVLPRSNVRLISVMYVDDPFSVTFDEPGQQESRDEPL